MNGHAWPGRLVAGSGFDPYVHKPGTNLMRRGAVADIAFVADSTTALSEGVPPTSNGLTIAYSTITAVQRGIVVEETDLAEWQSPYDLMQPTGTSGGRERCALVSPPAPAACPHRA
jgi:hypothetical protein